MRKIKVILSVLALLVSFTSVFAKGENLLPYRTVVEFEGKSKSELYTSIKKSLAHIMGNSNYAIVHQDAEEGIYIVKCNKDVKWNFLVAPTDFDMTINIKDGRIRVSFDNVNWTYSGYKNHIENEKMLRDFKKAVDPVVETLKNEINNQSKGDDDDW